MFVSLIKSLKIKKMLPIVYVGTYSKYNNGSIFGKWVDLSNFNDLKGFWDYCKELHKDERDPEFMFQDWENDPLNLISECSIDNNIYEIYNELKSSGIDLDLFGSFISHLGVPANSKSIDYYTNSYCGYYDSDSDFAESFAITILWTSISSWPYNCIDWDHAAKELMRDHFKIDGHYFRNI
jgi:antirestriction protein